MNKVRKRAPGQGAYQAFRSSELLNLLPANRATKWWLVESRCPYRIVSVFCGSANVRRGAKLRMVPFGCREKECSRKFSVRIGKTLESSNLGHQTYVYAICIVFASLKVLPFAKLHRDLGNEQRGPWYLPYYLCDAMSECDLALSGSAEAMEAHSGGSERTQHQHGRTKAAGRRAGKAIVTDVVERPNCGVVACVADDHAKRGLQVFTGQMKRQQPLTMMRYTNGSVAYSAGQLVGGMAHTNEPMNSWTTTKCGHHGVDQGMSNEYFRRFIAEFQCRHNVRSRHAMDHTGHFSQSMDGKRPICEQLIVDGIRAERIRQIVELFV